MTGVQTCALPILLVESSVSVARLSNIGNLLRACNPPLARENSSSSARSSSTMTTSDEREPRRALRHSPARAHRDTSDEICRHAHAARSGPANTSSEIFVVLAHLSSTTTLVSHGDARSLSTPYLIPMNAALLRDPAAGVAIRPPARDETEHTEQSEQGVHRGSGTGRQRARVPVGHE